MAISKIILNGVTQMDLTQDTTDASKTLATYTGHGADGEAFTGTATSGVDIPSFEVRYDGNGNLISATCTKTYAQCADMYDDGIKAGYLTVKYNYGGQSEYSMIFPLQAVTFDEDMSIIYIGFYESTPNVEVHYADDGEITYLSETEYVDVPVITSNGDYFPSQGVYAGVIVEVPSSTTLQTKSVTPTESSQTVTPDSGYDGLSSVSVGAISNSYVGSGITRRSSSDLTASGATVTVPSGFYEAQASKAVASGTAGTPTATKGTVSNHSVTVTPSVTNTTGYIQGGTKTGTAVSVSASELVSGTLSITSSGTKDVTNYASASVASGSATASATKGTVSNHSVTVTPSVTRTAGYVTAGSSDGTAVTVSASELVSGTYNITTSGTHNVANYASASVTFSTIYTGSSDPSSSQGSNGDIYIKVVS